MIIIISFCAFLAVFVILGVLSVMKSRKTKEDYLLAGSSIKPWMAGLSAVATSNSGYMFVGMIGYTYSVGISSIWLLIGWFFGDLLASFVVYKKLRIVTKKEKVLSFPGLLSRWHSTDYKKLRILGGVITLLFLGVYAAAQFNAGSKALHALFGWNYALGAVIGAVIVLLYCFAGGIRASIWTDVAQSFVMVISMVLLFVIAVIDLGGFSAFTQKLSEVSSTYTNLFPSDSPFGSISGPILFVLGWVFAGYGVVGQPHIMSRVMTIDSPKNMNSFRIYYFSWCAVFYTLAIGVGLVSRLMLPEVANFDAELSLPTLSQNLLPDILVGLVLAGLFSAAMSTADSQILSCSASLTQDFNLMRDEKHVYLFTKMGTVFITSIALIIALSGSQSVYSLVLIAWAALASAFAPLLTVYAFGGRPSENTAITMVISGIVVMLLWSNSDYASSVYKVLPGMLAGFTPFILVTLFSKKAKSALNNI